MTTVNLACREGHTFEAWFRSKAEFSRQHSAGLVACPWCGEREIERRPSVPNVIRARGRDARQRQGEEEGGGGRGGGISLTEGSPSPSMRSFASALRAVHRYIERTCDDVGDRFAVEARRMHEQHEAREEQGELSKERALAEQGVEKAEQAAERGIYGQATVEEVQALEEDGISVSSLPPLPSRYN